METGMIPMSTKFMCVLISTLIHSKCYFQYSPTYFHWKLFIFQKLIRKTINSIEGCLCVCVCKLDEKIEHTSLVNSLDIYIRFRFSFPCFWSFVDSILPFTSSPWDILLVDRSYLTFKSDGNSCPLFHHFPAQLDIANRCHIDQIPSWIEIKRQRERENGNRLIKVSGWWWFFQQI